MREVRKLYSPVHGAVSSLCELNTGGERHRGEGFAVSARSFPARLYYRLAPAAEVLSPADGAVTAAENDAFRLRTGDGLELEVLLPCGAEYFVQTGDMARAGEPVCRISSEELRREKSVVKVQFTDSSRMTELHVLAGQNAPEPPPLNTPRETHSKRRPRWISFVVCFLVTS